MRFVASLRSLASSLLHRSQIEGDLDEELRAHIANRADDLERSGLPRTEAERRARIEFGGQERYKEECREERGGVWLASLWTDVRFGLRMLSKSRGFSVVAVITLALGIGANAAIFSMVNALLLHPYHFRDLDALVRVWEDRGIDEGYDARYVAPADAKELSTHGELFESIATYEIRSFSLGAGSEIQPALGCRVTANFFDVLSVSPTAGRLFSPGEEQPGDDQVAIVSDGFWKRRYAADPHLLGEKISLNGRMYSIVGIMPKDFDYPVPVELWVPLALTPEEQADRTQLSLQVLGRLKDGVMPDQTGAALANFSRRLEQDYPKTNAGRTMKALQLRKELYVFTLPLFLLLQAAAGFVLLLACANLANLVFARMIGRQREIALRTTLGAGRGRLGQLFLSEMLLYAIAAGIVAITASFASVKMLRTSIPAGWTKWVPGWNGIRVDGNVLAFTIAVALGTGLVLGLATVLHASHVELNNTLKETGAGSVTPAKRRVRSALVIAQVMFAFVLLVCAGLTIQGFVRLADIYRGFQPASVLRLEISLPEKTYPETVKITNFYQQLVRDAASLPGVQHASLITNAPASNVDNETTFFNIEGQPALKAGEAPSADLQIATPDFFATLKISLISGRFLSEADNIDAARVVVISPGMAQRFWPGDDPVGHRIKLGTANSVEPWVTIAGVVGDVRQNWWNPTTRPVIYKPFAQSAQRSMTLLMRTQTNPASYVSAIREVSRQIDPGIALRGVATLEEEVNDSIAIIRIMGILMGIFGLVALVLSSIGVYGVLSESVAQRTREIGIRLALGAETPALMKLILGHALKLTAIGLAIALPVSLTISRAMTSLIFGVVSMNATIFAAFAAVLLLVGLGAGYLPARRAMNVDPMVALRYE
ncbi:MAG TPA: ABC transporter permease [Verrucomicrobiae bacterium]|nr:ABC transporter permease [Verrucomicrobiae bacterium]